MIRNFLSANSKTKSNPLFTSVVAIVGSDVNLGRKPLYSSRLKLYRTKPAALSILFYIGWNNALFMKCIIASVIAAALLVPRSTPQPRCRLIHFPSYQQFILTVVQKEEEAEVVSRETSSLFYCQQQ